MITRRFLLGLDRDHAAIRVAQAPGVCRMKTSSSITLATYQTPGRGERPRKSACALIGAHGGGMTKLMETMQYNTTLF